MCDVIWGGSEKCGTSFRGGGQRNVWRHLGGGGSEICDSLWQGGGGQKSPKIAWRHLWTAPNPLLHDFFRNFSRNLASFKKDAMR